MGVKAVPIPQMRGLRLRKAQCCASQFSLLQLILRGVSREEGGDGCYVLVEGFLSPGSSSLIRLASEAGGW